jgi:hypothetical protein
MLTLIFTYEQAMSLHQLADDVLTWVMSLCCYIKPQKLVTTSKLNNCMLPKQCIYVFRTILKTNSDYFPTQH